MKVVGPAKLRVRGCRGAVMMGGMNITAPEILAVVVDRGSWHGQLAELDGEPLELRRQLRVLAKDRGIRLHTSTSDESFVVSWPEHEPTELQKSANLLVVRTMFTPDAVTYDEALAQLRRERFRAV